MASELIGMGGTMRRATGWLAVLIALLASATTAVAAGPGGAAQAHVPGLEAPFCQPGEPPQFHFGILALAQRVGEKMGQPIECQHPAPDGSGTILQHTTTGLAVYDAKANSPMFTNGFEHWAILSPCGLFVSWTGQGAKMPDEVQIIAPDGSATLGPPTCSDATPTPAAATPTPGAQASLSPTIQAVPPNRTPSPQPSESPAPAAPDLNGVWVDNGRDIVVVQDGLGVTASYVEQRICDHQDGKGTKTPYQDDLNVSLKQETDGVWHLSGKTMVCSWGVDNPAGTGPQWTDVEMVLSEDQGTLSGDWYNQTDKAWEKGGIKITRKLVNGAPAPTPPGFAPPTPMP